LGKNMILGPKNKESVRSFKKLSVCRKNNVQSREMNFVTYEYDQAHNFKQKKMSKKILRRYIPNDNI
jgi:hypothetical protein